MVPDSTVPIWLLDFDGVLNTIQSGTPMVQPGWIRMEDEFLGKKWPILAAEPVLDFIRRVHDEGLADIRWHTTWQEEIHRVAKLLNLPELPVEPAPEYDPTGQWQYSAQPWWKLPAVWRLLHNGYRVLWTDDDIQFELSPKQLLSLRVAGCRPICPNTDFGLESEHLQAIETYLRAVARLTRLHGPGTVAPPDAITGASSQ